MTGHRTLLRPDRLRTVEYPFGWMPCRMLTNGTIANMSPIERQLYLVLVLAADRRGISYHGDQRIQHTLGCTQEELGQARSDLKTRDLLAYDGATYQLLTLPPDDTLTASASRQPSLHSRAPRNKAAPAAASSRPAESAEELHRNAMPESIRVILRDIFGRDSF